jgi:hypothetical protein
LTGLRPALRGCLAGWLLASSAVSLPSAAQVAESPPETGPAPLATQQPSAGELSEFDPPLGTYHYAIVWRGAAVARADLRVQREGPYFRVEAQAGTGPTLDRIYRLRYRGEAQIDAEDLRAVETVIVRERGRRLKETRMRFPEGEPAVVSETKRKGDAEPSTKVQEFPTDGALLDPFAFLFMVRSLDWEVGEADHFELLLGRDRWLVELNCVERVEMTVGEDSPETRQAWLIIPTTERLGEDDEDEDEPNVQDLAFYVAADASRDLLQVRTRTRVGKVRLRLDAFTPQDAAP